MLGGGSNNAQADASAASASSGSQALGLLGGANDALFSDGTSKAGGNPTTVG